MVRGEPPICDKRRRSAMAAGHPADTRHLAPSTWTKGVKSVNPLLFNAYSSLDLKQVVKRLKWTSVLNSYLL